MTTPEEKDQLVTVEDHLNGFKDVTVSFRDGTSAAIRLHAPTRKASRGIEQKLADIGDLSPVVDLCLGPGHDRDVLDKLTPGSANIVEATSMFLVFGWDFQKKIEAEADQRMSALFSAVAKPSSSAPAGLPPTSTAGPGRPFGSA